MKSGTAALAGAGVGLAGAYWGIGAVASERGRKLASPFVVSRVPTSRPAVALTFDDGPNPDYTKRVVDTLGDSRATFFVLGAHARRWPQVVRKTVDAGHEIASHGFDHSHLWKLSPVETLRDLRASHTAISDAAGRPPVLYRPPHGLFNLAAWVGAPRLGMRRALWSTSSRDWAPGASPTSITACALEGAIPGSVILLHDGGADDRPEPMLRALPALLAALHERGLEAVTLSELLSTKAARP